MPDAETPPIRIAWNRAADRRAPWTAGQNAILSDRALADAQAAIRAWPGYAETPLHALGAQARRLGICALHYKDESSRFGLGSFKALGGAYAVERLVQARGGDAAGLTVCCATDGNHGRSVAWGAAAQGCRAVIFVHATVSERRADAIAAHGAEVRRTPGTYDDSLRIAQETAAAEGWQVVSDTSYPGYMDVPRHVMQGYETMAAEAFDRLAAPPTHIFLQTGVGGLAAAVAGLAKRRWGDQRPTVVLADPVDAACWVESFAAGAPTAVGGALDTIMAGLACGEVSLLAWEVLRDHADAAIAVPDDLAAETMRRLARPEADDAAIVAGESAVAGLAALELALGDAAARAALGLDAQSRVLVIGSEGATDPALYRTIVGLDAVAVRSRPRPLE